MRKPALPKLPHVRTNLSFLSRRRGVRDNSRGGGGEREHVEGGGLPGGASNTQL